MPLAPELIPLVTIGGALLFAWLRTPRAEYRARLDAARAVTHAPDHECWGRPLGPFRRAALRLIQVVGWGLPLGVAWPLVVHSALSGAQDLDPPAGFAVMGSLILFPLALSAGQSLRRDDAMARALGDPGGR